jgi:shikimate dehydrogenase
MLPSGMRYFGLIGYPLSHSFSKQYFTDKFEREGIKNCQYDNYPIEHISLLPELVASKSGLAGLNVTIPYKEQVIQFLEMPDQDIACIGAVNTIKIIRQGNRNRLIGYNTDVYGFHHSISPYMQPHFRNALILGTGGSSKAVAYVLHNFGLHVIHVSRSPSREGQISYKEVSRELIEKSQVIVNASPVGMYPNINSFPDIPYEFLTPGHVLFDLIYNPAESRFLALGKQQGTQIINGLQMLHLQAERSWIIWNEK